MPDKRIKPILILLIIVLSSVFLINFFNIFPKNKVIKESSTEALGSKPKTMADYTLVFVGDSMTELLGNFDELREDLKNDYLNRTFLLLNYGFGSTNILSLPERLEKDTTHAGRVFQNINDIPFDLIFIESFGHNPLSELPLEQGLKKQTEILDESIEIITKKHPKSSIIFIATIAPNKFRYGEGTVNLSPKKRTEWAEEREAYIKNHIRYAIVHNIPVINIYEKSLKDGTGNIDYISSTDFIHPSPTGVFFISSEIEKFIFTNNLVPK